MNENQNRNPESSQELSEILQVRRDKLAALQQAGKDPFTITKFDVSHHSVDVTANFEALENQIVRIAGRMMVKRVMGKASFFKIQDREGLLQCYTARDSLGEENYAEFKKMDIGDILGIEGFVFKTKTGEVTVHAKRVTLLSKSLKPLPEKFHGLTDVDARYRRRCRNPRFPTQPRNSRRRDSCLRDSARMCRPCRRSRRTDSSAQDAAPGSGFPSACFQSGECPCRSPDRRLLLIRDRRRADIPREAAFLPAQSQTSPPRSRSPRSRRCR